MKRNHLIITVVATALLLIALACSVTEPKTRTPTPVPTNTPRPTATPLPPKPVVPYTPVPADMLSPIIIQRSPKRGESFAPDGSIEIVFDKAMDHEAVAQAFRLQPAGKEAPVKGKLTWADERTLRFTPAAALPRDTVYDVILTQNASAATGELLREPYTFRFATAGYLEVAQVIPAPDTADAETAANITVIFNRPVVPLTSLAQMTALPDPLVLEPDVAGHGEWLNTSIYVFTPDAPLAGGVTYSAKVSAGLQDIAGAVLAEDYLWHFTILPPKVLWTQPRDGDVLVDINTAISVQFNQPIDLESAHRAFHLEGKGLLSGDVSGTLVVNADTLTFTPTQSLDFDTVYTVRLDPGVTSTAGGTGMKEGYTWRFTTVPLPEIRIRPTGDRR